MPFRRIADAGINIGLGTDEASVDDGINYLDDDEDGWPDPQHR